MYEQFLLMGFLNSDASNHAVLALHGEAGDDAILNEN